MYLPDEGKASEPLQLRAIGGRFQEGGLASQTDEERRRRELEARLQQARAAGQQEGQAAAREQAAVELKGILERTARSLEEIGTLRHRLRRDAEGDLVQLSMAIARRILHRELAMDPEALRGLILGALEKLNEHEISRVRVHPAHVGVLRACLERLSVERIEVHQDPALPAGGIVFETQRGNLDASVETQLEEIGRGLADRLRKDTSGWKS
jgi:flagellar assembly protein FliH